MLLFTFTQSGYLAHHRMGPPSHLLKRRFTSKIAHKPSLASSSTASQEPQNENGRQKAHQLLPPPLPPAKAASDHLSPVSDRPVTPLVDGDVLTVDSTTRPQTPVILRDATAFSTPPESSPEVLQIEFLRCTEICARADVKSGAR